MVTPAPLPAIAVAGLRKSFGDQVVLDGIDLTVAEGTIFALLGGAGSSRRQSTVGERRQNKGGSMMHTGHLAWITSPTLARWGNVMAVSASGPVADWRVRGSYFEGCNCEAICPCRSVGGRPGGPSSFGECFGALSWHIHDGHADGVGLSSLRTVMSIRYLDRVRPSTPWEVVLYVDEGADGGQRAALADIFLGRAGGTVARLYGPAIGEVHVVRPARITLEHTKPRKRIDVVGYLTVEAEGDASEPGDVRCGIPGFDHPGTELHGDTLRSTDPALRWEVRGRRHAAFTTDFDYRSDP